MRSVLEPQNPQNRRVATICQELHLIPCDPQIFEPSHSVIFVGKTENPRSIRDNRDMMNVCSLCWKNSECFFEAWFLLHLKQFVAETFEKHEFRWIWWRAWCLWATNALSHPPYQHLWLRVDLCQLHPGRLTWNLKMMVWKMIFLFQGARIFRFYVNLRGCTCWFYGIAFLPLPRSKSIDCFWYWKLSFNNTITGSLWLS